MDRDIDARGLVQFVRVFDGTAATQENGDDGKRVEILTRFTPPVVIIDWRNMHTTALGNETQER